MTEKKRTISRPPHRGKKQALTIEKNRNVDFYSEGEEKKSVAVVPLPRLTRNQKKTQAQTSVWNYKKRESLRKEGASREPCDQQKK